MVVERAPGGGGGWTVDVGDFREFFFGGINRAIGTAMVQLGGAHATGPEIIRVSRLLGKELRSRRRVEVTAEVRA